ASVEQANGVTEVSKAMGELQASTSSTESSVSKLKEIAGNLLDVSKDTNSSVISIGNLVFGEMSLSSEVNKVEFPRKKKSIKLVS
ncbi:MAG: hypothetical protein VX642_10850, partial [Bdellovibrionota bacterium]|nr:hypothetical protein [Bdellovibrionota bacterium]